MTFEVPTGPALELEVSVEQGPSAGSVFVVRRFPAILGRGVDADVRLEDDPEDPRLSRQHARLDLQGGRIMVRDQSTNGTWMGTRQLAPGEGCPLEEGEPVWLGPHTMLRIRVVRASGPWSPPPPEAPRPEAVPGARLQILALGPLRVTAGGVAIPDSLWETRKAIALLAMLAESWPQPLPADRLADTLWPDDEENPRQVLQTTVSRVRRAFRKAPAPPGFPAPVAFERDGYGLDPSLDLEYDVRRFEDLARRARSGAGEEVLTEALALVRGTFLQGLSEDWAVARRRAVDGLVFEVRETLAALRESQERWADAVALYEEILLAEPCRDSSQLGLVRALHRAGRRDEALRRYHDCVAVLDRVLGVPPGPDLARYHLTLLQE